MITDYIVVWEQGYVYVFYTRAESCDLAIRRVQDCLLIDSRGCWQAFATATKPVPQYFEPVCIARGGAPDIWKNMDMFVVDWLPPAADLSDRLRIMQDWLNQRGDKED